MVGDNQNIPHPPPSGRTIIACSNQSTSEIVNTAKADRSAAGARGPSPLPTKIEKFNRAALAPHVDKRSREKQFEIRHATSGVLDIVDPTPQDRRCADEARPLAAGRRTVEIKL